ncbi:hypothetical protein [Candidatus Wolbachia massiliensis]|uniref:Uncharacterized protein n=1 Tax=Candidatus Wolbachia massiliensis TaxID=1845000 RepID=A0A7M3U2J8_9RICK|nr:hypothetical protein [Candidatus Wolbachia massiliensis]QOD38633.1 hypothetical protein ID128_02045 [Candidatus Wolbachia massiliensis]
MSTILLSEGNENNWELKLTTLKPLIAISSLLVFSVTAGYSLSYVIAAASGTIAAVPLAIFAVSTFVALVSAVYLFNSFISTTNSKKKVDLSVNQPNKQDVGLQTDVPECDTSEQAKTRW